MFIEFPLRDLIGCLYDCLSDLLLEAEVSVCLCRGLLQESECTHDRQWHALAFTSDLEVLERSLRLGTPVFVPWDLNGAECVFFLAGLARGQEGETSLMGQGVKFERLLGKHGNPYLLIIK